MVIAAACVGVGVFVVVDDPSGRDPVALETTSETVSAVPIPPGRWDLVPTAPIAPRSDHAAVWTGAEMIVWGGDPLRTEHRPLLADGAAYDPATRTWRRLPPAPISARSYPAAVWTGREVIVWGGLSRDVRPVNDGAAYDPREDRWRRLARPPIDGLWYPAALWTGREMVVHGPPDLRGSSVAALYDPARDTWRRLPDPPFGPWIGATLLWTGQEILVFGGHEYLCCGSPTASPEPTERRAVQFPLAGAAYNPATGRWRTLPSGPVWPDVRQAAWDGKRVLAWGTAAPLYDYSTASYRAAAFYPSTDRWELLAGEAPVAAAVIPTTLWTGTQLLTWNMWTVGPEGGGEASATYDPTTGTWRKLPAFPLPRREGDSAVWAGNALIVWGGMANDGSRADGAALAPNHAGAGDGWRRRPPPPGNGSVSAGSPLLRPY